MPSSLIEVRRPYGREDEVALIDAVHGALVAAFKIPSATATCVCSRTRRTGW